MDPIPIAPRAAAANCEDAIVIFDRADIYLVFVVLHDR
jgi:hypothetical protein